MTPLEEISNLEAECYAVWGRVTVISMKLAVLGDISLGVWVIRLSWPLDFVAHVLHDGYTLDGFVIEGVLEIRARSPWCDGRSLNWLDDLSSG